VSDGVESVGADDLARTKALRAQLTDYYLSRLVLADVPSFVTIIAPGILHRLTLEAPLEPPHLNEREMTKQLERRPT